MATELKTRKYSKEQMISYLEKRGSTLTEAANIAGTNPRTLGRYLSNGVIPTEWYTKITAVLKDRKPVKKTVKTDIPVCSACGKSLKGDKNKYNISAELMKEIGAELPVSGWHWYTNAHTDKKVKMYPVCETCYLKAVPAKRKAAIGKKSIKGKVTTKKN